MSRALTLVPDRDVIAALRALLPARDMTWAETHSVAERQATALLGLLHIDEPPVPQFVISSLPGIVVDRREGWPTSGMAVRARSHWRIVLKADEPRQRQRFSLAHEFKHILDHRFIDVLYEQVPKEQRAQWVEQVCDYFRKTGNQWQTAPNVGRALGITRGGVAALFYKTHTDHFEKTPHPTHSRMQVWRLKPKTTNNRGEV